MEEEITSGIDFHFLGGEGHGDGKSTGAVFGVEGRNRAFIPSLGADALLRVRDVFTGAPDWEGAGGATIL